MRRVSAFASRAPVRSLVSRHPRQVLFSLSPALVGFQSASCAVALRPRSRPLRLRRRPLVLVARRGAPVALELPPSGLPPHGHGWALVVMLPSPVVFTCRPSPSLEACLVEQE